MNTRTSDIWKAVSVALLGKPELRGFEVTSQSGVSAVYTARFWQALGFPAVRSDQQAFAKRDVEIMRFAASVIDDKDGPDLETLLQMARGTGQALSRVAHMHVTSIAADIEAAARSNELSNNEAADRIATMAEALVRSHETFLAYIWRRHLLAAISQVVAGAADDSSEGEDTVVGFADLVDFTAASQLLTHVELAEVVDRFERIAYQQIPDRGGRVVKTLGDEVMFTNANSRAAAETALALAMACQADELLPDVRVGLATGPMLAWEGDLYGPTVNLAHRLVGVARPGTVIVTQELAERLGGEEDFQLVEIRDVKLKGIGKTKPWVLRRRG